MARLFSEWQRDFSGGWVDSLAPNKYARNQVAEIINGRIGPDGTIQRRPGTRRITSGRTAGWDGERCYGAFSVYDADHGEVVWLLIFAGEPWVFRSTVSATPPGNQLGTGFPEDYWYSTTFTQGGVEYTLLANGGTNVYKFTGFATGLNAAVGYPSGVKYLAAFNDRVWYAGHSDIEVVGTKIGAFEDHGTDAIELRIQTHDGDHELMGLHAHRDGLLVFKRNSVSIVDGYGDTTIITAAGARGLSGSIGCIAPRTIQAVGEGRVVWLSKRGVELYQPGAGIVLLSTLNADLFRAGIDREYIRTDPDAPCAVYDPANDQYRLATRHPGYSGGDLNNVGYIYDFRTLSAALDLYDQPNGSSEYIAAPASMAFGDFYQSPGAVFMGNYYGDPLWEDSSADTDGAPISGAGGVDISMTVKSRPLIYADEGFQRHRARLIEVLGEAESQGTLTIKTIADGNQTDSQSRELAASSEGGVSEARIRTNGRGRTIQAEVTTTDRVKIAGLRVGAEVLKDPV